METSLTVREADGMLSELTGEGHLAVESRDGALVYSLYTGLTAMAGVLIGAIYAVTAQVGPQYALLAFFVVVLAGLGSVLGVLVAGLFLGVLQAVVTVYVGPSYTLAIVFGVLFLTLLVSPRGILRRGLAA